MKLIHAALIASLLLAGSSSAHAQTQAVFTGLGTERDRISSFDLARATLNWQLPSFFPIANWMVFHGPAISHDGRYAVWPAMTPEFVGGLVIRDLVTGAMSAGPFPASVGPTSSARIVIAHPRRLQFFVQVNGGDLLIVDPHGVRVVRTCFWVSDATLSVDGTQLFIACDERLLVIDTTRETIDREWTVPYGARRVAVNGDGSRLTTIESAPGGFNLVFRDSQTGSVLATHPSGFRHLVGLHSNADRSTVYASYQFSGSPQPPARLETFVYDVASMSRVAALPVAFYSMAFWPDRSRAVAIAAEGRAHSSQCRVMFMDPATHSLEPGSYLAPCRSPNVQLVTPPLAPSEVDITVSGRNASFAWQLAALSPDATSYAVDASLQPGGPVIATVPTGSDQLTFAIENVPPGTYYVRVRAINAMGSSPPSAEQRVVVQ